MHTTETLPLLPGQIGTPCAATPVLDATDCFPRVLYEQTEAFTRVVFPPVVEEEEEQVAIEDLKTMILERPESPYANWTKVQLYRRAKELGLPGRSRMTKPQLRKALIAFEGR